MRLTFNSALPPALITRLAVAIQKFLPDSPEQRHILKVRLFRIIGLANIVLGLYYFYFRYTGSVNPAALWIALPLLLAETYSFIDTLLFIFMMWQPRRRTPPAPLPDRRVDVFIATYSEPVDLVRQTAEASLKIRYPHQTYVLDDGNRPDMRAVCAELGCGYITRDPDLWQEGVPRHAKAGNIINALQGSDPQDPLRPMTAGEFILILDADQLPDPEILDETLGYFADPKVAFVQTPQYFYNVPPGDPFGSQAPLFYGPIQQGKDGWNAAFFCGSNAVLRREALMQLGLVTFSLDAEARLKRVLSRVPFDIGARKRRLPPVQRQAAEKIATEAEVAVIALNEGQPLAEVMEHFYRSIATMEHGAISDSLASIERDLAEIEALTFPAGSSNDQTFQTIYPHIAPGMQALETKNLGLEELMAQIQLNIREAFLVNPLATFSITEDMATAMRLHALGWKSVYHAKILAQGLAPEDLPSALGQKLRWAAGTIQVLAHENPLLKPGLSLPQRLQYFTTMYRI